jgi:hypothetical protein
LVLIARLLVEFGDAGESLAYHRGQNTEHRLLGRGRKRRVGGSLLHRLPR